MVQRLQPTTLNASSYCKRRRLHCALGRGVERRGSFLYDDAGKPAQDDFDLADLVPTAFGAIGIRQSNRNPLD